MVSNRLQRKVELRRKLHILRTITRSKSEKKCIIKDAILYISLLKLKLESIRRELSCSSEAQKPCLTLLDQPKREVMVEKTAKGFVVRVEYEKKGGNNLVQILEVFEKLRLTVLEAKVSCNSYFSMEAVVAFDEQNDGDDPNVKDITRALLKAIDENFGES